MGNDVGVVCAVGSDGYVGDGQGGGLVGWGVAGEEFVLAGGDIDIGNLDVGSILPGDEKVR